MLIAKELKKTNNSEYLIYMFQVEDMIRLNGCDFKKVDETIVSQFKLDETLKKDVRKWYESICRMMKEEGLTEKGHLQFVHNQIRELTDFHYRLLEHDEDTKYPELFNQCQSDIEVFRNKLPSKPDSEIEVCLYALYSLMLMRLKKMTISPETHEAMTNFGYLMAHLSKKYHDFEQGRMEIF